MHSQPRRPGGVKLGNPKNLTDSARRQGAQAGLKVRQDRAAQRADDLAPILADIRAGGAVSLRQIAVELNARGIPTTRGGSWSAMQVRRLLERVGG